MSYSLTDSISELLGVPINERGVNAMLRCPLHEDDTPSFSIHLDEGMWHCFGCQESGSISRLYRLLGEEVGDEVRIAQALKRAEEPDIESRNMFPLANSFYHKGKTGHGSLALSQYANPRGITPDALDAFFVGYDEDRAAIAFPYIDSNDKVTGIKYRYGNGFKASESGSSYGLFGRHRAVGYKEVVICEGETDTLSVYSYLEGSAVGVCGTSGASVSKDQWVRLSTAFIFAKKIYLAYDADKPGDDCADRAWEILGSERCVRIRPPEGKDMTEWLTENGDLGGLMKGYWNV